MGVPTITSVTPATGPTGGRTLVSIVGTNFRLPADPPPTGPVPVPGPTVAVTFGGHAALRVRVFSATLLVALAPPHVPETVSAQVQNLDTSGNPISGEVATKANGYSWARPNLTVESNLTRLVRALVDEMKRQVIENVVPVVNTDYSSAPSTGLVMMATLPGICVFGPSLGKSKGGTDNEPVEVQISDLLFDTLRPTRCVDLTFNIIGVSDSSIEMLNLLDATQKCFDRTPLLAMARDPANPGAGVVEYEMAIAPGGDFAAVTEPNESNVRNFKGVVVVRGFVIEGLTGVTDDLVSDRGGIVGEAGAEIQVEHFADE